MAGTEMNLRKVDRGDAERIRRILKVSFEDEYRRMGQKNTRLPTMTDRLIGFYLDRSPEYSFVVEGKGGAMGFCLACRWGSTGWMGPIAVLPPAQGRGYGKMMVEASASELTGAGVTTLGIETMPRSYRNLQFYSRMGMRFEQMTLDMSRVRGGNEPAGGAGTGPVVIELNETGSLAGPERDEAIAAITAISGMVSEGLDYRVEVEATARNGMGETLLASSKGRRVGFAVLHTEPYAREEKHGTIRVNTLVLAPEEDLETGPDKLLDGMLGALEAWADDGGYDAMIFRVPVRYWPVRDMLLRRGFRISHSDVRMTCAGFPERDRPGLIHLSKWE